MLPLRGLALWDWPIACSSLLATGDGLHAFSCPGSNPNASTRHKLVVYALQGIAKSVPGLSIKHECSTGILTKDFADCWVTIPLPFPAIVIGFRVIDFAAGRVYNYAGQGTGNSKCGDGGLATAACLWNPTFAAVDSSNNLYFSDKGNNCIRRIDAVTGFITTLASASDPSGVAYDGNGGLYVFVKGDKKLYRINTATGVSTWIAGSGSATYLDGAPVLAGFVGGNDLTVDVATGNIYLSDTNGYAVRKISMPSGNVSTFAGNYPNYMFSSASDGKPAVGQNLFPYAMAIDTSGNVYAVEAMSRMTSNA